MLSWLKGHHKKIQEIGTGLFLYEVFNNLYDYIFYPFMLAYFGLLAGGVTVVFFSFIINGTLFWLYDYMKVDWLGAHALRQLEDEENKSNINKLITWLGKKKVSLWEKITAPIVFITLTLAIDPLIVAIHHRREHFRGVGLRDWGLLLVATAAANLWWLLKVGLVVEIGKFLWHLLFG